MRGGRRACNVAREGLHPRKSRSRATIADAVSRVVKASLRAYGAMNGAYVSLGVLRGVVMIPGKCLTRRASSGLRQDERNGMHYDVGLLVCLSACWHVGLWERVSIPSFKGDGYCLLCRSFHIAPCFQVTPTGRHEVNGKWKVREEL